MHGLVTVRPEALPPNNTSAGFVTGANIRIAVVHAVAKMPSGKGITLVEKSSMRTATKPWRAPLVSRTRAYAALCSERYTSASWPGTPDFETGAASNGTQPDGNGAV